jgi:hypothetical protein
LYGELGVGEEAAKAERNLKNGFEYAKSVFPEMKDYIKQELVRLGYKIKDEKDEKSDAELKDPEILPIYMPSETVKGKVDGKKVQEFAGVAAGVVPIAPVLKYRTEKGTYLMFANIPLADFKKEVVEDVALHEYIHMWLDQHGVEMESQKPLEPYIEKWIANFYRIIGQNKRAANLEERSGYLNGCSVGSMQPYVV